MQKILLPRGLPQLCLEDTFAENSVSPWPPIVASQMQMQDLVIMRRGVLHLGQFLAHSKALDEICCMVPSKSPNSRSSPFSLISTLVELVDLKLLVLRETQAESRSI